jgi:hypothetical protein
MAQVPQRPRPIALRIEPLDLARPTGFEPVTPAFGEPKKMDSDQ